MAHPFFVLIFAPNSGKSTRIGVAAGRSLGNAVQRNRAKRRLKACIQPWTGHLQNGLDIIFLARKPILAANFAQLQTALKEILIKGKIIEHETINSKPNTAA